MSERPSVAILYGVNEHGHPKTGYDRMLEDRQVLQEGLSLRGIDLHVAYATTKPGMGNLTPSVMYCDQPTFDNTNRLSADADFRSAGPKRLHEATVVVDRWSENYLNPDGPQGIGLPPEQVINHHTVQIFGADKMRAYKKVLEPCGVGIPTFEIGDPELADHIGGSPVIVKPRGGALGAGVRRFSSLAEMYANTDPRDDLLVQPFYDFTGPITFAETYNHDSYDNLVRCNASGRMKEVRVSAFMSRTLQGGLVTELLPVLRSAAPGEVVTTNSEYALLDPVYMSNDELIDREHPHPDLLKLAGQVVTQFVKVSKLDSGYVTIDFGVSTIDGEQKALVVDFNTRLPRLRGEPREGVDMFALMLTRMIRRSQRSATQATRVQPPVHHDGLDTVKDLLRRFPPNPEK